MGEAIPPAVLSQGIPFGDSVTMVSLADLNDRLTTLQSVMPIPVANIPQVWRDANPGASYSDWLTEVLSGKADATTGDDPIVDETISATFSIPVTSKGKLSRITHAAAQQLTMSNYYNPTTGASLYPGATLRLYNNGANTLQFVAVGGFPVFVSEGSRLFVRPYGVVSLKDLGTGVCLLVGALQAGIV